MTQPKFMLVDDNPIDLMVNRRLLQNTFEGATVNSFNNSVDAVEFFKKNGSNSAELPNVVLLDIIMPRLDGFQVIEELEKIFTAIPFKIFLLSSTLDDADFDKAKESRSVQKILGKPLDTENLKTLI
ncbi:MAG: response regulator [Bdellovibrionales bacterium]